MADETIQQPPVTPKYKLWQSLNSASYYTKPYADFDKQFSTSEQINKLHSALSSSEYYTKSSGEFTQQFFTTEKKNPIGNDGQNIAGLSQPGSNLIPNSQSADLSPILPENRDAVRQQQQAQIQAQSDHFKKLRSELPKESQDNWDKAIQVSNSVHPDNLSAPTKEETDHYNFMQTPMGKTLGAIGYLGSKATKGTLQIAKGAAYLADLGTNPSSLITGNPKVDKAFDKADKVADFGLTQGDQQHFGDNPIIGNLGGLAEFLPAAAAAIGTGGATLYLQGLGQGKDAIDAAEKQGTKVNPIVKNAFILGTGAVNGALMGDLGNSMFKSLPAGLRGDITASITADAIKEASGKELTGEAFKDLLDKGAKTFSDKLARGGAEALNGYKHAVTNLSALATANFALKKGADMANDKPIFNENLGNLASNLNDIATKQAPFFAIPSAIGAVSKLTPYSDYKNTVVESLMHDSSTENTEKVKQDLANHAQQYGWTPEETKATINHVEKIAEIAKSLPKNLPENKIADAVDLVQGRNQLQAELDEARKQVDPALKDHFSPSEQLLTDKIEQANDKLRALVTGKKLTVSKGVGEDEGNFYKTIGDKQEPIEEGRYKLDALERDSKTNNLPLNNNENESSNQEGSQKETGTESEEGQKEVPVPAQEEVVKSGTDKTVPETIDAKKQKAIDAVTHGIVYSHYEKFDGYSPRFDFSDMDGREKRKAVSDIIKGNYETAPAKKMLKSLMEWDKNDNYPTIEGNGGHTERVRGATAEEIQNHIDDAKANKIGELSQRQVEEINKPLQELGFTKEDFDNYEQYRNSAHGASDNGRAVESPANIIQQSENDQTASSAQSSGSSATQGGNAEVNENASSIKNAKIDEDRQKRGLSPLMSETAKDFPKVWDEAMQKLEDNPDASKDLVKELAEKPRSTTDVENALLAHRLVEVKNKYDKLTEQIVKAQDAGEDTTDLNDKLDNVSDELHEIESVSKSTGRETARGLNSRKMMIKDDFSLAALETKKRVATGRKLTTEEREGIRKIHADYEEKSKAYEQKIADLEQRNRDLIERDALQRLKAEAKKEGRAKTRSQRDATKSKLIDDIRTKLKESRIKSQQLKSDIPFRQQFADLIKISPELAKLAKLYIDEGVDKLDDLVDKLHDELKDAYDGLSKRAVRDALSGYGKESEPVTKGDLQVKLEELRKQAKLQSKLEDLEAKEYKSPERKKQQVSDEIAGLKKQIRDLEQPDISLKALKTRTANQIKEYERRLKERDFSTAPPRIPIMLDPEAITARADLDRVRDDFNAELEKDRLANRGKFEKGFDTFLKYRRAELLLNLSGAAKVGMASAYRILGQPLHEIAGSGLRQIPGLKQIAEKAPREGAGFVSDVEWKALKSIWSSETLAEVKKKFQGKLDNLDTVFGDKKEHFDTSIILDLAGNIHSAEKTFAKHNEFRRSVMLRTIWARENGIDTENPFVQEKIGVEALEDANRQIFMGSNLANDAYRELLGSLESKSKENKYGKMGKISAGALRTLLPIVRVPTNFLIEKVQYTPILGATKALYIMSKGLENMQPKEADYVMRVMKKQSIGAGLMLIGYFNPQAFGGFHVPGGKRKEGDLSANDIKLFGVQIPHWLTHTPLLTIMQLGATIRRAADGDKKNPIGNTSLAIGSDLAESTPFYETPKEAIKAMENSKNFAQFVGNFARSLVVPNIVAQEAQREDKDSEGNLIKRNPHSIMDGIKEGIPVLRKQVPVKLPHPGFDKISLGEKDFTLNNDQILEREKYYNQYLKSEYGTKLQDLIKNVKTEKQKKKFTTILHGNASKFSKVKILQKYRNEKTGGYNFSVN